MTKQSNLYLMEAVNLICGEGGDGVQPGESTHLTLRELKLPTLEETFVEHRPGGAAVAIEIPIYINRLEARFTLAGWQAPIMRMLGSDQTFTAYGVVRSYRDGRPLKAKSIMWGRLGRIDPSVIARSNVMEHEYVIRSILHYELDLQRDVSTKSEGGDQTMERIYYWDFFESTTMRTSEQEL